MNKAEVIEKLRGVKPMLSQNYGLSSLALFGSYSRDEQNGNSDIDLLIDFSTIKADTFFSCAFALQDLFQNIKVDIVTRDGVKPKYFEAIENDLIYA